MNTVSIAQDVVNKLLIYLSSVIASGYFVDFVSGGLLRAFGATLWESIKTWRTNSVERRDTEKRLIGDFYLFHRYLIKSTDKDGIRESVLQIRRRWIRGGLKARQVCKKDGKRHFIGFARHDYSNVYLELKGVSDSDQKLIILRKPPIQNERWLCCGAMVGITRERYPYAVRVLVMRDEPDCSVAVGKALSKTRSIVAKDDHRTIGRKLDEADCRKSKEMKDHGQPSDHKKFESPFDGM
ncbi:MAG: hypothetical protein AAGI17_05765 [Planctomycetota bacterium]